jgi:uncharacterized protein (DUF1501 family)
LNHSTRPTRRTLLAAAATIGATSALAAFSPSEFAAPQTINHRRLVCIFLYGGNDGHNLLIPTDDRYPAYARLRGPLALPRGSVRTIETPRTAGSFGLHPSCGEIQALFNNGTLTFASNITSPATTDDHLFAQRTVLDRLSAIAPIHSFDAAADQSKNERFPKTCLGAQLCAVAKHIESAKSADEILLTSLGGFDLHHSQTTTGDATTGAHARLLHEVSESLGAFHRELKRMRADQQVLTFTVSEFGRSICGNSSGSDHGPVNHHLLMGPVAPGTFFGQFDDLDNPSTTSFSRFTNLLADWQKIGRRAFVAL